MDVKLQDFERDLKNQIYEISVKENRMPNLDEVKAIFDGLLIERDLKLFPEYSVNVSVVDAIIDNAPMVPRIKTGVVMPVITVSITKGST